MAQFLTKFEPGGWKTGTIDRATATIDSSLKLAAEHFGNADVNVIHISLVHSLSREYRGAIRKGRRPDGRGDVKECFFR